MKPSLPETPRTTRRGPDEGFQVLLYHGLYKEKFSRETFQSHLLWLKENGYRTATLSDCRKLSEAGALPEKILCLTFDDGMMSHLRLALPVLQETGAVATFFITPAWLGEFEIMSGSNVRELAETGMEIGSHSLTHPFLTEVNDAELEKETRDSRAFLEDLVGRKVESFSYPFGDVDARVREATMRAGYRIGCGTQRGRNPVSADWLMLRRSAVYGSNGLDGLVRILLHRSPNWTESAAEFLKRCLGTRRYRAWRGHLARRGRR